MKYISSSMKLIALLFGCIGMMLLGSADGMAQTEATPAGERVMFIQIKDLNPDDYFKIQGAFKDNPSIFIRQACIPAEVIMFGIGADNQAHLDENYNEVKGVVLERTSLNKVSILAEYTENDFMERCKMFRLGGSDAQ